VKYFEKKIKHNNNNNTTHTECVYGVNYNTHREFERGEEGITGRLNSSHTTQHPGERKGFSSSSASLFCDSRHLFFFFVKYFGNYLRPYLAPSSFFFPFSPDF
jgi:hypothetical protein